MRLSWPGGYGRRSRRSRTASMPRLLAASISMRSSVVPSRIETHDGHAVAGVAVLEVGAVDGLGEDPRERRLAGAARPDEQDGVADPVGADGVAEGLDDRLLADDLAECLGAPAPIERLVRDGRRHDLLRSGRDGVELPCTLRRPGRSRAHHDERLGPGRSAAPDDDRLVLLPSGPDTVRGSPLRGTRSSTSRRRAAFENGDLGRGFSPAVADCRYRAPLVPRLARLRKDTRLFGRVRPADQTCAVVAEPDVARVERPQARERPVVGLAIGGAATGPRGPTGRPPIRRACRPPDRPGSTSPAVGRRRPATGGRRCGPAWRRPGCPANGSWSPATGR